MENLRNWYFEKCEEANFNRLGFMALILLLQTCIFVPACILLIGMNGGGAFQVGIIALLSFGLLVSFLGDLPAKMIVPFFLLSVVLQLFIILINVF
jgi:hypothetical protein